jgi:hypothetical protein
MALDTYAALQTSIGDWLNRSDLTSQIPDFIALAEARFNRELRTLQMETRISPSISAANYALPADWLETVNFSVLGASGYEQQLQFIDPAEYAIKARHLLDGDFRYYTQIGSSYYILPPPTTATTFYLNYRQKIPALSNSNTSNWLLAKSPDLYLYGSLLMAEPYLQNDERIPLWAAAAQKTIADINLESDRARQPRGQLMTSRRTFG